MTKAFLAFIVCTLALCIFGVSMTLLYPNPDAKLIQEIRPPAAVTVEIYQGEVLIQPLDKFMSSTKYPGSVRIQVSRIDAQTRNGMSFTPIHVSEQRVDDFQMFYINKQGYDTNIYASRTGVRVPDDHQPYIVQVTYYPDREKYSLSNQVVA